MIFQNEKQMMAFVQQSLKSVNAINLLLFVSFVISAIILLKELVNLIRSVKRVVKESESFGGLRKIFQKSRLCSVCREKLSCVYNTKCKHMVICQECLKKGGEQCKACKNKGGDSVEMFVC